MPSSSNRPANRKPIWRSTTRRKIFWRQAGLAYTIRHRNFKDKVHKHGFELELNYDYGRFFTN
ncbi:hypothetical protein E8M71_02750, partial [Neisseria gonorrhoeae]|uniref:hypothetical protein n=1 Tax=Neisseria gonorrhoeae TaxID=485 RepID=UPI0011378EB8